MKTFFKVLTGATIVVGAQTIWAQSLLLKEVREYLGNERFEKWQRAVARKEGRRIAIKIVKLCK